MELTNHDYEGVATEKKPQLFYYEEGLNAWIPTPERVDEILDTEAIPDNGDTVEIKFKRIDMSDIEVRVKLDDCLDA